MVSLNELLVKLQEVAKGDGTVTPEEEKLLHTIKKFIGQYEDFYEKANEDNIIDEDERSQLKEMRKWILEGAWVESQEDGVISKDESDLIDTVYGFLKNLEL